MSKWIDARKTPPPDPGEIPARYLVILDTKSPAQHCKTWAGMGLPEFASYYKGWHYPWNARGSLEVAYWMEPPKFDMRWQMNDDGTPGEWVPNVELRGAEQASLAERPSRTQGSASLEEK